MSIEKRKQQGKKPAAPEQKTENLYLTEIGDQFVKYKNGIILDKNTGLEWIAGPDVNYSHSSAIQWIWDRRQKEGGWRAPTQKEMKALIKKFSPMEQFNLTGKYVWLKSGLTSALNGGVGNVFGQKYYSVADGMVYAYVGYEKLRNTRVLAVRTKK